MNDDTYIFERPETFERIPFDDHALVEASAGTGKTYTIERLVAHLLLTEEDLRLPEILVVTFTERATGELRERIRALLEQFLRGPGDAEPTEVHGEQYWRVDAEARKRLEKALFSFDLAPIYTMHGFCRRVLTEHAFANNQPFDLEHVDHERLFDRAFTRALRERFADDEELRPYLEAWFDAISRPLETLRTDLLHLVGKTGTFRSQFEPETLASTARDFAETDAIAEKLEAELADEMHHNTWRAVEGRIGWLIEATERFCETGDMPQLLAALGTDGDGKDVAGYLAPKFREYDFSGPCSSTLRALIAHRASIKDAVLWRFLPEMQEVLGEEKRIEGELTFDDMLTYVWEALEGERGESLARALRDDYEIALIDEFQDTDELQWKIFRRIFYEGDGDNRFYLIGDPKQAIYGFRGADVFTYYEARDEIVGGAEDGGEKKNGGTSENDGGDAVEPDDARDGVASKHVDGGEALAPKGRRRVDLPKNYRSTPDMIEAYNRVFTGPFFTGHNDYPRPVEPGRPDFRAEGADGESVVPFQLFEMQPGLDEEGEPEEMSMGELRETYAAACAREIATLLEEPESFVLRDPEADEPRTLEPKEIQVLTRTRKGGERIGRHLRERGVPFAFYKQEGLFETAEARHIHRLLRAVAHPHDRSLRQKAWLTPFFDLDLAELDRCRELGESESPLRELFRWHDLAEDRAFGRLFNDILSESGLVCRELFAKESEREVTNYLHIFEILVDASREEQATVGELALRLKTLIDGNGGADVREDVQRLESERNAVQIMTMHKAKGLEADVVFVAPTFNGFDPSSPARVYHDDDGERIVQVGDLGPELQEQWEAEQQEASERLLYVAITRARARVYLPYVRPIDGEYPMSSEPGGTFQVATRALTPIVEAIDETDTGGLFELRRPALLGARPAEDAAADGGAADLADWSPPEDLLEVPIEPSEYRRLRARTPEVVSFSRLAGDHDVDRTDLGGDEDKIDETAADAQAADVDPDDEELPSNIGSGLMLHDILEHIDFEMVRDYPDVDAWLTDDEIDEMIREEMQWRLDDQEVEQYAEHTKRMVYRTLMTPIRAERTETDGEPVDLGRLADVSQKDREAEFFYPTPTPNDAELEELLFDEDGTEGLEVGQGFVNGKIDFLFERDGRVYIADWKSNRRASYAPGPLARYVDRNYALQLKIYVLAAARAIDAPDPAAFDERMGGFCFFFVRGIEPTDGAATPGVYFRSVDFETVRSFENDLREIGGRR